MGLSGGFGNLTMGRIWSASENNAGGWRFLNPWFGSSDTDGRISHAVSYAFNSEMAGFQIDAVMDPKKNTGQTIDEVGIGATIKLGELGKIGFAHRSVENQTVAADAMVDQFTREDLPGLDPTVHQRKLVIKAGETTYAPIMLSPADEAASIETGVLTVAKWEHDGEEFAAADAKPKATVVFNSKSGMTGSSNDGKETMPNIVKVVDVIAPGGDGSAEPLSNYKVSKDGKTYTVSSCAVESPPENCESRGYYFVLESQADPAAANEITATTRFIPDPDNPGSTKAVTPADKMVHFWMGNSDDISISATVPGTAETSTVKSVTPASIRIEGADYEAKAGETTQDIVTGVSVDYKDEEMMDEMMDKPETTTKYGWTENHVTLQLGLGAMTGTLGYTEVDKNDEQMDKKITFLGLNGAIGDTGMSWTAYSRNVDGHDGSDTDSWGASLSKSLGAGTSAYIDHGNDGEDGRTFVGLSVSF